MPKKNVAVVFGVTANYVSQLANVLIGLQQYSPDLADDVIVYHDGISQKKQRYLKLIGQPLIFVHYNNMIKDILPKTVIESYSACTFSRFECFNLLNKYAKVIWLDVDIIIQKNICGILNYGEKTGFACTVNDCGMLNIANFLEPIPGYSMYVDLYNAGLFVLTDILPNYSLYADWCYSTTRELAPKLRFGEQGPFNLLIQRFSIDIELIDILRYVCHPERDCAHSADIVHSYGAPKFWNSMELDHAFPEWRENNRQWQKIVTCESRGSRPKVTVLMTVYERGEHLEEAVRSILNQTLSELELLVIIEKSEHQDRIEDVLLKLDDDRIVIVKNDAKLGFAASLNIGLDMARGEYIARMDDDDYSTAERLQVQTDFMDANPDIAIAGSFIQCFGNSVDVWDKVSLEHERIKVRLLSETQVYHPTAIMRKSELDTFGLRYNPEVFTEDYDLWARAAAVVKLANIPRILVRYRASGTNITLVSGHAVQKAHLEVMRKQIEMHLDMHPTEDELLLLSRRIDILPRLPDRDAGERQKRNFVQNICEKNKRFGYYDQKILQDEYLHSGHDRLFFNAEVPVIDAVPSAPMKDSMLKRTLKESIKACFKGFINIVENTGAMERLKEKVRNQRESVLHNIRLMHEDTKSTYNLLHEKTKLEYISLYEKTKSEFVLMNEKIKSIYIENNNVGITNVLDSIQELHEHIDWVQRDILITLKKGIDFNASMRFACITEYPVAYDSPDHIHPVGTVADHTRHPRFIRACEDFFPDKKRLSFLDLGCSAGGIVLDAVLYGHIGIGLEGSNLSRLQQRAEWRLLRENLFTCDISKPFILTQNENTPFTFDVVSAWEVLEHLTKEGVDGLFNNVSRHTHIGSILACSISQVEGGFTDSGAPLHQTIEPLAWWEDVAGRHGFERIKNPPLAPLDYARGSGNPSVYYRPLHSYKEQPGDCELAVFQKITQL